MMMMIYGAYHYQLASRLKIHGAYQLFSRWRWAPEQRCSLISVWTLLFRNKIL